MQANDAVRSMTTNFTIDIGNVVANLPAGSGANAADIFGPHEELYGSRAHVYFHTQSGIILHPQNYSTREPLTYRVLRRQYITFQFTIIGRFTRSFDGKPHAVRGGTILISRWESSQSYVPKEKFDGVGLFTTVEQLVEEFGLNIACIPELYHSLFGSEPNPTSILQLAMPATVWAVVQDIVHCPFTDRLYSAFLQSKATELLCYTVSALNKLRREAVLIGVCGGIHEHTRLQVAERIFRTELTRPPSLDDVARRVGMNRNSLTAGFREMFNTTPYDYSRRIRLERSRDMLRTGTLRIERIASVVGYTNHAAFSRAFSKEFGFPPSEAAART